MTYTAMHLSAALWRFFLFGVLGICGEVFFTALIALAKKRTWRLQGESYIWMFPIYGLIAFFFEPLHYYIAGWPLWMRGIFYMFVIYVVEYACGAALKKLTGGHIWHYKGRYQLHGHIHFLYAPVWFAVGLLVEKNYGFVVQLSEWLARHVH